MGEGRNQENVLEAAEVDVVTAELAPPWRGMVEEHDELAALLDAHQEALVDRDGARARQCFARFRRELLEHIDVEEQRLLPRYEALGRWHRGGAAEIFRLEHRRVQKLLDQIGRLLDLVLDAPGRLVARNIIRVIERQRLLKGLLEHHNHREQLFLYPALNEMDPSGSLLTADR